MHWLRPSATTFSDHVKRYTQIKLYIVGCLVLMILLVECGAMLRTNLLQSLAASDDRAAYDGTPSAVGSSAGSDIL